MLDWPPSVSCEPMYIDQPPCEKKDLNMKIDEEYFVRGLKHHSTNDRFATMGYIRDLLVKVDDFLERISDCMVVLTHPVGE